MTNAAFPSIRPAARRAGVALAAALAAGLVVPLAASAVRADDAAVEQTVKDIEATLGFVPSFVKQVSPLVLPGAWSELKAVEFSDGTAIPMKYKALIGVAVSAQIPCQYCVWLDTQSARAAGATDEEIEEAVAIASIGRHWSAIFNGMQVDFDQMKSEFSAAMAKK
jgi:AhpD family alkylhydroperoxidase